MGATPQDVQSKIADAEKLLSGTTLSWPQMEKKYGPDWTKWPMSTLWWQAFTVLQAASAEAGQLAAPTPPPPTPASDILPPVYSLDIQTLAVDPNSAALVSAFLAAMGKAEVDCSVAVATTADTDPSTAIAATSGSAKFDSAVYRPSSLKPGTSSDHHASIYDPIRGRIHDLWLAKPLAGAINACKNGGSYPPDTVNLPGDGATAANTPLRAGLIWPDEYANNDLSHCLAFSIPNLSGGMTRYPAYPYNADYTGTGIKLGTYLRFPADLVFPTMDTFSLYLCKRIQKAGMFCRDIGNPLTFYGADIGGGGNAQPWKDAGVPVVNFNGAISGTYIPGLYLSTAIPWSKLQVLVPPAP